MQDPDASGNLHMSLLITDKELMLVFYISSFLFGACSIAAAWHSAPGRNSGFVGGGGGKVER